MVCLESVLGPLLFIIYINDLDIGISSKLVKCCNSQLIDYAKTVMDNHFIHQVSTLPNTQLGLERTKGKLPLLAPTLA